MKKNITKEIGELLEKYFSGETTLKEERQLREYFSKIEDDGSDPQIRGYKDMFGYFSDESDKVCLKEILLKETDTVKAGKKAHIIAPRYFTWGLSAAAILVAGIFLFSPGTKQTFEFRSNGKKIHDQTQAMNFASEKMNRVNKMISGIGSNNRVFNIITKTNNSLAPLAKMNKALSQNKG
ncbi:MAG: hypothetical protein PHP30_05855 [Bacteroidales bacterium]|nr:hypothetical protein [Bacteroidales bacterium]MDD2425151.1 hypothetical protein [Bacteroidales bacterium]MDD3989602.1 hypothetical protein [Bacteroidales bacterium]MDD4638839.1 hypothetical protein [Bacteroidales bacterium]